MPEPLTTTTYKRLLANPTSKNNQLSKLTSTLHVHQLHFPRSYFTFQLSTSRMHIPTSTSFKKFVMKKFKNIAVN